MFDFISDSHGRFDLVIKLLEKAGYVTDADGTYFHLGGRITFFLGDFLDKGDQVFELFYFIKSMVDKGYAKAILGNHELNFIAIHTKSIFNNKYLRDRTKSKLRQVEKSKELLKNKENVFNFLYSLPLFYESTNFRVIHACWHNDSINTIKNYLTEDNKITKESIQEIYKDRNSEVYSALEILLKGLEVDISPQFYLDKLGEKRNTARLNWWSDDSVLETVPEGSNINEDKIK